MQGLYQKTNSLARLQLHQGAYRTLQNIEFPETKKARHLRRAFSK
jgi:hypothetical protein